MNSIGLAPFNIHNPTRETGDQVSHKIIPAGKFDVATKELLSDWTLSWVDRIISTEAKTSVDGQKAKPEGQGSQTETPAPKASGGQRIKYSCPNGHYSVWGKSGIDPVCGTCSKPMEPQ